LARLNEKYSYFKSDLKSQLKEREGETLSWPTSFLKAETKMMIKPQ
jgi:hypothetical protein